jgi:hypothetical protein
MAVAKAMAQSMPLMASEMAKSFGSAMIAAEAAKAQSGHDALLAAQKKKLALEDKCYCCRQSVGDGKGRGCGGPWRRDPKTNAFVMEPVLNPDGSPATGPDGAPVFRRIEDLNQFHIQRVVYPTDPIAQEWFMGITINGAVYQSAGEGHLIWTPKVIDIDSLLSAFQVGEREQRIGRKHVRKNGGTLSGNGGSNTAPLGVGFN